MARCNEPYERLEEELDQRVEQLRNLGEEWATLRHLISNALAACRGQRDEALDHLRFALAEIRRINSRLS